MKLKIEKIDRLPKDDGIEYVRVVTSATGAGIAATFETFTMIKAGSCIPEDTMTRAKSSIRAFCKAIAAGQDEVDGTTD